MCSHLNVKFHRTPNSSQDHRFMTLAISEHSNHFDLITVARVLFTHQQQFKIATRSSERFRPPTFGEVESSRTRTKKSHSACTTGKECRTWLRCREYSAQFVLRYAGTVENGYVCHVPHAPRTRIVPSRARLHGSPALNVLSPFPACHVVLFLQHLVG